MANQRKVVEVPRELRDCGSCQLTALSDLERIIEREVCGFQGTFVLNVREVTRYGATFLGVLARAHSRLLLNGGRLQLLNSPDHMQQMVIVCGMKYLLPEQVTEDRLPPNPVVRESTCLPWAKIELV